MTQRNLELNLGRRCNNRCIFCLDATAPRESRDWLPLARARGELERARKEGAVSVGLLGGEPTAHPQILDIVGAARELGFERIALASNGLKLDDEPFARQLVDGGVTRVTVSIHGHQPAIEDELSGRQGNFQRKVRALQQLLALRREGKLADNVSLNAVLTTRIVDTMPAFVATFAKLGIQDVRFNFIRTDTCEELGRELTPRLDHLREQILHTVAMNERRLKKSISYGDLPLCAYPWEVLSSPRLASTVVGEARDLDTFVAIFRAPRDEDREAQRFRWTTRKRDALKVKPRATCYRCKLTGPCEGVWRSYHALYGEGDLRCVRSVPDWMSAG